MKSNILKSIRENSFVQSAICGLLSNIMIFGTFYELVMNVKYTNQHRVEPYGSYENSKTNTIHQCKDKTTSSFIEDKNQFKKTISDSHVESSSITFHANETHGVISSYPYLGFENTKDNFFTINIPNDINLSQYDAHISYDLYGLSEAHHTVKSINGSISYGGMLVGITEKWSKIEEQMPVSLLKQGTNEIHFSGFNQLNHTYQLKNLKLHIKPKSDISSKEFIKVINENDNVYCFGKLDNQEISFVEILNVKIPVVDGVFEQVLNSSANNAKSLTVNLYNNEHLVDKLDIAVNINVNTHEVITLSKTSNEKSHSFIKDIAFHSFSIKTEVSNPLQVTALRFQDLRGLSSDIKNVTQGLYEGYRLESYDAINDSLLIEASLIFDPLKIPEGYTAHDVRPFYYDALSKSWRQLPVDSLDIANHRLYFNLVGDTDYLNGVISVPEMPETSSFSPTTISGIDYANPTSGVVSIAPPSPSNMGGLSTNFPIKLPAGRNGIMPNLNVIYNSEGGNGWMGVGWDLKLPSISINTKWGVPRFDLAKETELYTLNGEELVYKIGNNNYSAPHRLVGGSLTSRVTNAEYYSRVEKSYQKITRHGNSPTNYVWEVTDKTGTRYLYGGNQSPNNSYIIRDINNNIVHWALYRTIDVNGNYVDYQYTKENSIIKSTGNVSITGVVFRPLRITYTRNLGVQSYYSVFFRVNTYSLGPSATLNRPDKFFNGRLGVLEYTKDLLTQIEINYHPNQTASPQRVRTYRFDYQNMAFNKTLLQKISEYDAHEQLFYTNTMEYFQENFGNGLVGNSEDWGGAHDNVVTIFPSSLDFPSNYVTGGSALGTSTSTGFVLGMRFGIGFDVNIRDKNLTFGFGYNHSQSTQIGRISFIDMNGDGLPDKVINLPSGGVVYRLNNGSNSFSHNVYSIDGINSFERNFSKTNMFSTDATFFATIGRSWNTTRSNTDGYFMDVNGDGLPDIVQNGRILFNVGSNHFNSNLSRSFVTNVNNTENPILPGAVSNEIAQDISLPTLLEVLEEHPQYDAVRLFESPYTGNITVNGGSIQVLANPNPNPNNENNEEPNTFRFSIEKANITHNNNTVSYTNYDTALNPTNSITSPQSSLIRSFNNQSNNAVKKGDLILFRSHNLQNGSGGNISWNPTITYIGLQNGILTQNDLNALDENNKNLLQFNASNDFIITGGKPTLIEKDKSYVVDFKTSDVNLFQFNPGVASHANNLTDDVEFRVLLDKISFDADNNEIITTQTVGIRTYNPFTQTFQNSSQIITISTDNNTNYEYRQLRFVLYSDSNINYERIQWKPTLNETSSNDVQYPGISHVFYNDRPTTFIHKYPKTVLPASLLDTNPSLITDEPLFEVTHNLSDYYNPSNLQSVFSTLNIIPTSEFPIDINLVVKGKRSDGIIISHKRRFRINREFTNHSWGQSVSYTYQISNLTPIQFTRQQLDEIQDLYVGLFCKNEIFVRKTLSDFNSNVRITKLDQAIENDSLPWQEIAIHNPYFTQKNNFAGSSYRGWGQFLYHGGIKLQRNSENELIYLNGSPQVLKNFGAFPIETNEFLNISAVENINPNNLPEADELEMGGVPRFLSYDNDNLNLKYTNVAIKDAHLSKNQGTLSTEQGRFAEKNVFQVYVAPSTLTSGSGFVGIRQHSITKGKTTTAGYGPATTNESDGNTKILNQYIDLNGDRYPDLITSNKIQYTNSSGALSFVEHNDHITNSSNVRKFYGVTFAPINTSDKTIMSSGPGVGFGKSTNEYKWVDLNGDGLPDKVRHDGFRIYVKFNLGYTFTTDYLMWFQVQPQVDDYYDSKKTEIVHGVSSSISPLDNGSFGFGYGFTASLNNTFHSFTDVNGDGLPDLLLRVNGQIRYHLNTGTSFETNSHLFLNENNFGHDQTYGFNYNVVFTHGFFFTVIFASIKKTFTLSSSINASINHKDITLQDIDGDGYVDVLRRDNTLSNALTNNSRLLVRKSIIGKTHLLKKVNLPLGGSWEVDYARVGNTYDMPQSKWVVSSVTTYDAFTGDANFGPDRKKITVSYHNPKYDRRERDFLGFQKIVVNEVDASTQEVLRYTESEFFNNNVYLKGALKSTAVFHQGQKLSEKLMFYNLLVPESPVVNLNVGNSGFALQGSLQQGTINSTLLDRSRIFVAPVKIVQKSYEGNSSLQSEQWFTKYDSFGNLKIYKNIGTPLLNNPVVIAEDSYETHIDYYDAGTFNFQNATGFPKQITVKSIQNNNQIYRKRNATYDGLGRLQNITVTLNQEGETNNTLLHYDNLGNIVTIDHLDSEGNNTFYSQSITYDAFVKTYPTTVSDNFGHSSTTEYNLRFGIPTQVTDINLNAMRTSIDSRGRIVEIIGPNEFPNGWTIRKQYFGEGAVPVLNASGLIHAVGRFEAEAPNQQPPTNRMSYAITRHHIDPASNQQLLTVSMVDGLGQLIQLKKTNLLTVNNTATLTWLNSGKEKKDALGRVTQAWLPTNQNGYPSNIQLITPPQIVYDNTTPNFSPTEMTYDMQDRIISVLQPGESTAATTAYSIEEGMFVQSMTNELSQKIKTFTDIFGRQRKVVRNEEQVTQFYYNAIGEKIRMRNAQNYETHYRYDMAGRRIEERSPDRGIQKFKYDKGHNLTHRQTSNHLTNDTPLSIQYHYTFNRLDSISYPKSENNVYYRYGSPVVQQDIEKNAVGRLLIQRDASGVQSFAYDKMGNLTEQIRAVAVAGRHSFWFKTQWTYDSFQRLREIIYPDKEKITYLYNNIGQLHRVTRDFSLIPSGNQPNLQGDIVSNIKYSSLGEQEEITYGNLTKTTYEYDARRRMEKVKFQFSNQYEIYRKYEYDPISNITGITTLNPEQSLPANDKIGGPVQHTYGYDAYNRLTTASGRYVGNSDVSGIYMAQEYTLQMSYDIAHNIISKKQTHTKDVVTSSTQQMTSPITVPKTTYEIAYNQYATGVHITPISNGQEYGYAQPHAPREIIEKPDENCSEDDPRYKVMKIAYDANGNQTLIERQINNTDDNSTPTIIPLRKNLWDDEDRLRGINLDPNGDNKQAISVYTYDASGQRIVRHIPGNTDIQSNAHAVSLNKRDDVMIYPNALLTGKILHPLDSFPDGRRKILRYTKHYYINSTRVYSALGTSRFLGLWDNDYYAAHTALRPLANQSVIKTTTAYIEAHQALGQTLTMPTPQQEIEYPVWLHNANDYDGYFYHADHLGSSNYITNLAGQITQSMVYMPFGELLADEHLNSYNTPFKFNAKEHDMESGLYYYGARYYDAKWSVWLSVDPLAEKYPSISPYAYVANNPINAIDPDGRLIIFVNGLWGKGTGATAGGTKKHWGAWWIKAAQNQIGDHRATFYDGSADWRYKKGGTSRLSWNFDYKNRMQAGYMKGRADAANIVNGLERDEQGNITESIKFVTSSMGTAFARGMSKAITQYVDAENQKIDAYNASLQRDESGNLCDPSQLKTRLNVQIEFTVDLDAFQGAAVGTDPNAQSNYYMKKKNSWAGGYIPGSVQLGSDAMEGHHPSWAPTELLPVGTMNPSGTSTTENPSQ